MAKVTRGPKAAAAKYIAKLGQNQEGAYTTVEDASRFVSETGIDALAIAIGSAHGFYKSAPH